MSPNRRGHRVQPTPAVEPRLVSAENSQKLHVIAYSRTLTDIVTDLRPPAYWKHFGQGAIDELNDQPWQAQVSHGYRNGRHRINQFQTGRYPS